MESQGNAERQPRLDKVNSSKHTPGAGSVWDSCRYAFPTVSNGSQNVQILTLNFCR